MTSRQKEFIANASHELKTPLTRAISSLEVLDSPTLPSAEIQSVKEDLFHINDLLNKLLFLTKLRKGNYLSSGLYTIDMKKLFQTVRDQLGNYLEKKQMTLLTTTPDSVVTKLPSEYLEIILSNLISNAVKYSMPGKKTIVNVIESDAQTCFTIQDEGIGMTEEETHHMFDRFYRGKTLSNKEKGYGIGLSIVKQICDIYDLNIHITSQKGKGTMISFCIKTA
jgi:signal transduction histidine kinase